MILGGFGAADAAPVAMEAFSYKKIIIEAITNNFYFNCAASKSLDLTLEDLFHISAVLTAPPRREWRRRRLHFII